MEKNESLMPIGEELKAEALAFPKCARELVVTNDQELVAVNEFVKGGMALQKEIRAGYDDIIESAHSTWKGALSKRDCYLKPVSEGVEIAKGKMAPYMEEQRRKQREAEEVARRAQEEAQAALRRAQEEAEAKALAIEEERQRKAREALHDGERKKAEKILEENTKEFIPVKPEEFLPAEIEIPKKVDLKGTHMRTTWGWELENIDLVPRILPNGKRPLQLDRAVITDYGVKHKENAKMPGIRFFPKTGMASKGE